MNLKRKIINIAALAIAASALFSPVSAEASSIDEARSIINSYYYREVGSDVLSRSSIPDIIDGLEDPHTSYMTKEQYESFIDSIESKFYGVGFYFEVVEQGILINSIIKNSPAESVGLQVGDIVVLADGTSLAGLSNEAAATAIRGPEGTTVRLGILRQGTRLDVSAVRGRVQVEYVSEGDYSEGSGYIRISSFGAETGRLFGELLGRQNSDTLVLDLRNNGGGYMNAAIDTLGYLIPGELAMTTRNRVASNKYTAPEKADSTEKPVVLLVNEYSASASEIVAGALKDYKRALIIGSKSYGKGTAQNFFNLSDGGVLKMTTMEFLSPLGNAINGIGISPDVEIAAKNVDKVADILRSTGDNSHFIEIQGREYSVNLDMVRSQEYWDTYREFLHAIKERSIWSHYYPAYRLSGELKDVPLEKVYTVKFNMDVKKETLNTDTIDIVDAETGEETDLKLEFSGKRELKVRTLKPLNPNSEYWLKINPGVESLDGKALKVGSLATIETGGN